MLLSLHGRHLRAVSRTSERPFVGRICETSDRPPSSDREVLLTRGCPPGCSAEFRAHLVYEAPPDSTAHRDVFVLGEEMRYLAEGDVVRLDPQRGLVSTLYRRASTSNSFLVTNRCDNQCVMCSQPPTPQEDGWLVDELLDVIPLISPDTQEIGITGGEPTLLGSRLVELVDLLKLHLPSTAVHILSNGRGFADPQLARSLARVQHSDVMVGIPLYSDLPEEHDFVVQARGAFSQTIQGILNLKRHRLRVELRFVVHAETYRRLPEFARFVTRNLLFADHVALMGMELVGYGKSNLDALWIDPLDYQQQLVDAAQALDGAGMNVSIYNHQLCVLDPRLHSFARKAISDWKNSYVDGCKDCAQHEACGGFFASSALRRSRGIAPFS